MSSNNGNGIYINLIIGLRELKILMENCRKRLMVISDWFF